MLDGLLFRFAAGSGSLEPEAVVSGLRDVAMMSEPVEQGRGHPGIAEHAARSLRKLRLVVITTPVRS